MKTSRIFSICLGITLFIFMIAPLTFAQPIPFDGQWWQGKLSFKGYKYTTDTGNVLGDKGQGNAKIWLYTKYFTDPARYEVFTCGATSPYNVDEFGWGISIITIDEIYFGSQLNQLWNMNNGIGFDMDTTLGLIFTAIPYNINTYPVLLVKGKSLTQASISTVSCTTYVYDAAMETFVLGPCVLNAKTIDASKVSNTVPQPCIDELPSWIP